MLKIRLMRIGGKKKPFYRVVVVDERAKRTGGYLELLGTYNPLTEPKEIKLKKDRIDYWIKQGAQMSNGFLRIIGKAPQRPPRKPKKEKKEPSAVSPQPADNQKPVEQPKKIEETKEEQATEVKSSAEQNTSEPEAAKAEGDGSRTQRAQELEPKATSVPEAAKGEPQGVNTEGAVSEQESGSVDRSETTNESTPKEGKNDEGSA